METVTGTTKGRCRRCGADAFASPLHYTCWVRAGGGPPTVLYLCGPCGREFASDRERDEYVRLGMLA